MVADDVTWHMGGHCFEENMTMLKDHWKLVMHNTILQMCINSDKEDACYFYGNKHGTL